MNPGDAARRASRWLAYAVLAGAPLPFGSVEPVWVAAWCLLASLSLACADTRAVAPSQAPWLLVVPAAGAVVVLVALVQGLPANAVLADDLAWRAAEDLLGTPLVARPIASADPPWRQLGLVVLFVLVFTRAFLLACEAEGAERLVRFAAWVGLAYAVFAIVSHLWDPTALLWRVKRAYLGSLTVPFVNRNTAATYYGSAALLWLVRLLRQAGRLAVPGLGLEQQVRHRIARGVPRAVLVRLGCFGICLAATAMTGSRAGMLLTLLACGLVGALWLRHRAARGRWWWLFSAVAGLALLSELLGGFVAARIGAGGLTDAYRLDTYRAVLAMIGGAPWLGIGYGQFETVFPDHRGDALPVAGVWDRAHSTPLELAVELGLPALALVALATALVAGKLAVGALERGRRDRSVRIGALAVGALGLLHSAVDFSLQIPGYAVLYAWVTAVGLAQAIRPSPRDV